MVPNKPHRSRASAPVIAVFSMFLLSGLLFVVPGGARASGPAYPSVSATLVDHGTVGPVSSYFWSVAGQTAKPDWIANNSPVDTFLNASPFRFIRFGSGADGCDIANHTQYVAPASGSGAYVAKSPCDMNINAFKAWCNSLTPHCLSVVQLPAETNRTSTIKYEANYIVNTVGFQPTLWSIGNETTNWLHFGIAWTSWNTADNSKPRPIDYVVEVRNAITAIKLVDPSAKFVGVQAATYQNTPYFAQMAANYSNIPINWTAYHSYPSLGLANPTQIYSVLSSTVNISTTYATVRGDLKTSCPAMSNGCRSMPIQIGEYNHGPSTGTPYADGNFTDAVFLAASTTQALRANVSALTIFKLQSSGDSFGYGLLNGTNVTDSAGLLYQKVFGSSNFQLYGTVHNVTVRTTATSVWSEMTRNTTSCYNGLIVVNTDVANGLTLALNSVFPTSTSGTITWWNASTNASGPVTKTGANIGATIAMAPQSLLVLKDHTCLGNSPLAPSGLASHRSSPPAPPEGARSAGASKPPSAPRWA